MIINESGVNLVQAATAGDQYQFLHCQDVGKVQAAVKELRHNTDRGFSPNREYQMCGLIPAIEFLRHPEWYSDVNLIDKWLQSEEGRPYRVSDDSKCRNANIIVK